MEKATEYFEKALDYDYKTHDTQLILLNKLAFLKRQSGNNEEARLYYLQSLSLSPTPYAYNELALIYIEENNIEKAEILLNSALNIDPLNSTSSHYLGLIEMKRGNYEKAIELMLKALNTKPPANLLNNIYYNLALSYIQTNEKEKALEHLSLITGENVNRDMLIEKLK
jgi:tetratricopeptide (TPR) repeat protein